MMCVLLGWLRSVNDKFCQNPSARNRITVDIPELFESLKMISRLFEGFGQNHIEMDLFCSPTCHTCYLVIAKFQ